MWQPWLGLFGAPAGARADFYANPVVAIRDVRVATLICYEQLLVWPILQSALGTPDILVATSNGWWTSGTNIVAIQIAVSMAWQGYLISHSSSLSTTERGGRDTAAWPSRLHNEHMPSHHETPRGRRPSRPWPSGIKVGSELQMPTYDAN